MTEPTTSPTLLPVAEQRETVRAVRALLAPRTGRLLAAVAAFLVVGACAVIPPWMLGRVVDAAVEGGDRTDVVVPIAAIALAAVIGGVATRCSIAWLAAVGEPAVAQLREQVLDRVLHLDHARVEAARAGDVASRVGDDARKVSEALAEIVPQVLNSVVLVVLTVGGLFALDWRLGLAGLVAAPFYWAAQRWYLPRSGPHYRAERTAQGERAEAVLTGVGGAATVRAYGLGAPTLARIENRSAHAMGISIDVFVLLTRFFSRFNRAEAIGLISILLAGFWLVRDGAVGVGAVTAAALYFHRLFAPIGALLLVLDQLQSAGVSLSRMVGVAALPAPASSPADAAAPGPLEVHGVGHSYSSRGDSGVDSGDDSGDDSGVALHPTSLTLAPGERVALVGASGAGKTTLAAAVAGVLVPSAGDVTCAGTPLSSLSVTELRRRVVLVSQEVHVFIGTVRDQLTLVGSPPPTDAEIDAALASVGADWVRTLPDGLDTEVGAGAYDLTPAHAQHLALARVLLADPWFVVLDEATAEAGSAGARELERAAAVATTGRGALVVAHRLTQAQAADRILVMDAGRVVEEGTHDELVARGGRYSDLWAAWST